MCGRSPKIWEGAVSEERSESRELRCLAAIRDARANFVAEVVSHARQHAGDNLANEHVDLLRSNEAYHIAEFYFVIGELDFADPARIRLYLKRHNDDMQRLLS